MISKLYKDTITAITTTEDPFHKLIKLNCHLKNLTKTHQFSNCINLFTQIYSSNSVKPDEYTLSTTITACANIKDAIFGSQLHAHSIQSGLKSFPHVSNTLLSLYAKTRDLVSVKRVFDEIKKPDVYSYTTLVSACVKFGDFEYARYMFDEMRERNVAVWNAMITGCAENGKDWGAFDLFREMRVSGVLGDNYTFASVLSLCCLERFDFGRQVHCLVVKTGFLSRESVINSLLTMYFNCGSEEDACGVFEDVGRELGNEISYNAVITGLVNIGKYEEGLLIFKDMLSVGLKPTELTFVSVMRACECYGVSMQIHAQAIKVGFEECTAVNNAAITMYSSSRDLKAALMLFRRLQEKDIVSWNAIITSYAQENMGSDAMLLYLEMQRNGINPDLFTVGSLLACSETLLVVEMIQASVLKTARNVYIEVSNAFISAFSRFDEINQAEKLFNDMHSKNLISWNALINGFLINGLHELGLKTFFDLLKLGLKPNHYTLSLVVSICSSTSNLHHVKQVHAYILESGYFSHTLLGNALIAFYSKCGDLHSCLRVFSRMTEKDVISWNSVISAYAQHGEGEEAIKCFNDMQYLSRIRPDTATFTGVLSACSRSGLVKDAIQIFNTMVNYYGIEPEAHHFSCIVDVLGKAGFLDLAESVVKGIEIDSSVWWTLFSSCAAHGHLQLGRIIADLLLEAGNDEASVYVVLSNLYANAGEWEEAANVRELMKNCGVMKRPGGSWIVS